MSAVVNIKEADFSSIENCASIALLGKRRTGKTTWCKYILQNLNNHIGRFVALCGNKDNASEWKRVIQPLFVMAKSLEHLKKLRDYQDTKVSMFSEQQLPVPKKYRICIILDDCGSDRTFMHSNIIKDILSNGRHYGMTVIILCQYLNQMHSENRDQIDYLGMLHTSNVKNIRKVHDEYVNVCDLRTFKFVLNACSSKRGMCWIDNTRNPTTIEDCVFFKRIPWPYEFKKVGTPHIRQYGHQHHMKNKERITNQHKQQEDTTHIPPKLEEQVSSNNNKSSVDTESDDDDYISSSQDLLNSIPEHILANKLVFTDKRGSVVVHTQKNPSQKVKKE